MKAFKKVILVSTTVALLVSATAFGATVDSYTATTAETVTEQGVGAKRGARPEGEEGTGGKRGARPEGEEGSEDFKAERLARIQEVLDEKVASGTITEAQATLAIEAMEANLNVCEETGIDGLCKDLGVRCHSEDCEYNFKNNAEFDGERPERTELDGERPERGRGGKGINTEAVSE